MTRLVQAKHGNRLERTLQQLEYPKVLVDELGYLPLSREEVSAGGAALRADEQDRGMQ